jgi:hypothetical protein
MADFPLLKSGAVLQYPGERQVAVSTRVLAFVDGGEQRFRQRGAALRQWVIRLDLLTEAELKDLENFFRVQAGRQEEFTFLDPWSNTEIANCSLTEDSIEIVLAGLDRGRTTLTIRENRN